MTLKRDDRDIVEDLRANLERYGDHDGSGFTVVKELLQNADDASAPGFAALVHDGFEASITPLMRGPGLLVVNDGNFSPAAGEGMRRFGGSIKATDSTSIGRFGLGQKSVFHLCDTFLVVARGYGPADESFAVNPWEPNARVGDACMGWADFAEADADRLLQMARQVLPGQRHVVLWLPLRRDGLRPKPTSKGILTNDPNPAMLAKDIADRTRLAGVLATLRHIQHVRLGGLNEDVTIDREGLTRMAGPSELAKLSIASRDFGGRSGHGLRLHGREQIASDPIFAALRADPTWPTVRNRETDEWVREKGEPHGAVVLVHQAGQDNREKGVNAAKAGTLELSWSAFLPIGEPVSVPGSEMAGSTRLVLHGYFFVDSGRSTILFNESHGESADKTVRRRWNEAIRDKATLPLLPSALADAAKKEAGEESGRGILDLAPIVTALHGAQFFRNHRAAICAETNLIQRDGQDGSWATVAKDEILRPVPDGFSVRAVRDLIKMDADDPRILCAPAPRVLAATDPFWPDGELAAIIERENSSLFQSSANLRLMVCLLGSAPRGPAVANALLSGLRAALIEEDAVQWKEVGPILVHVPRERLLGLPNATGRQTLRALAAARSSVVAVRQDAIGIEAFSGPEIAFIAEEDTEKLLLALEPLMKAGGQVREDAKSAVLAIFRAANSGPGDLTKRPALRHLSIVPVNQDGLLSLQELAAASTARQLFERSGDQSLIKEVRRAMPDADIVFVEPALANLLRMREGSGPVARILDAEGVASYVEHACPAFAGPSERCRLVGMLLKGQRTQSVIQAARRVAAGDAALPEAAALFQLDEALTPLEKRLAGVMATSASYRLVPRHALEEVTVADLSRLNIEKKPQTLLTKFLPQAVAGHPLSSTEYAALFEAKVADSFIAALPIHPHADGVYRRIDQHTVLPSEWRKVPASLRPIVHRIEPRDGNAGDRLAQLVQAWTADRTIALALNQPNASLHWAAILSALSDTAAAKIHDTALRNVKWLPACDGQSLAPSDILDLGEATMEAAQGAMPNCGFPLRRDLAPDLLTHVNAKSLDPLLNDRATSLGLLADLIQEHGCLAGRLHETQQNIAVLRILAESKLERPLSGWQLQAALLRDERDDAILAPLIEAFALADEDAYLADMNTLAQIAMEAGRKGEAAQKLHWSGFARAASVGLLCRELLVPTKGRAWRRADETCRSGVAGVADSHRLADHYDTKITTTVKATADIAPSDDFGSARPSEIRDKSLATHGDVLEKWRGQVAPDLVLLYLRLAGSDKLFEELASRWESRSAQGGRDLWWERIVASLDSPSDTGHFGNQGATDLSGNPMLPFKQTMRERIVYAYRGDEGIVRATTLAGNLASMPAGGVSALLRGTRHQSRVSRDNVVFHLAELSPAAPPPDPEDARQAFLHLILEVGRHVHDLSGARLNALKSLAEEASHSSQATLDTVKRQLIDRLPQILDELKSVPGSALRTALDQYRKDEHRSFNDPRRRDEAKKALWEGIRHNDSVASELLATIRSAMGEHGYDASNVIFELFQNAEDAYRQAGRNERHERPYFRVETENGILRVWHEGRPINDRGTDLQLAEARGYDRDLLNMLVRNLSEKRAEDAVTGRFGLGFKSVHLLASEARVASGMVTARIRGAFLPERWDDAPEKCRDGATVIELAIEEGREESAKTAEMAFRHALPWIVATARTINAIDFPGATIRLEHVETIAEGLQLLHLGGRQALRFELGESGFRLLVELDRGVPRPIDNATRGLWCLAPLDDRIGGGWILDGPFRVNPGRNHVHNRVAAIKPLSKMLRHRLCALHDVMSKDGIFARKILAQPSTPGAHARFWSALHRIFCLDAKDDAAGLHESGGGWAGIATARPVVPTGLPVPFDRLVQAGRALFLASGALADDHVLNAVADWPAFAAMADRLVSAQTATDLSALKLSCPEPFTLADLLSLEMDLLGHRVGHSDAARFGKVLALDAAALEGERRAIDAAARKSRFPNDAGEFHPSDHLMRRGESVLDILVPDDQRVAKGFDGSGSAASFFDRARAQTGFDPDSPDLLARWLAACGEAQGLKALRTLLDDEKGAKFKRAIEKQWPAWLPDDADPLKALLLQRSWKAEDVANVVRSLFGMQTVLVQNNVTSAFSEDLDMGRQDEGTLHDLFDWWTEARTNERAKFDERTYPPGYLPKDLPREAGRLNEDGRIRWFTMLALTRLQAMGRSRADQHRSFLTGAIQRGWWQELAIHLPDDNGEAWLARLRDLSDTRITRQDYEYWWSECFVDFYALARWLDHYVEMILAIPGIVQSMGGKATFKTFLDPSSSPAWQRAGLDAASLQRPLNAGTPWLMRELLRHGVYAVEDRGTIARYCWSPTKRALDWLAERGIQVPEGGGPDRSFTIHQKVAAVIGAREAEFLGDFDMALQIAADQGSSGTFTRWRHLDHGENENSMTREFV